MNCFLKNIFLNSVVIFAWTSGFSQSILPDNQSKFNDVNVGKTSFYRTSSGKPAFNYWQNQASYKIDAELFPETSIIKGKVTLKYTNNSPESLDYIWMYLEQNRYTKDSRGTLCSPKIDRYAGDVDGGFVITNLKAISGKSLSAKSLISDTRMQVFFSEPVAANGGQASVSMDFEFKIPKDGMDRMGKLPTGKGTVFSIAQWYPRVCVFDDVVGWNVEPYLGAGEFFCEYGDYEYDITAPYDQIIVGSGTLINPTEVLTTKQIARLKQAESSDKTVMIIDESEAGKSAVTRPKSSGKLTWKFKMTNTRDVAFASSTAFIWDAARINLPSKKAALAQSVYFDGVKGNSRWGRSTEFVKTSIEHYSNMWFEYPYPNAINVASNVGGMEYPGMSFCGSEDAGGSLWSVTDHEFGHNWFPMIVGSNERRYAWMDEGFNTFINHYSAKSFNNGEFKSYLNPDYLTSWMTMPERQSIATYPDMTRDSNLGFTAYFKPALGLVILREYVLGAERFDNAFKYYIKTWAYKHPQPNDFFNCMNNVAGENLNWFWNGWFYGNGNIDLAITDVAVKGNDYRITMENLGEIPMVVNYEITYAGGKKERKYLPVEVWEKQNTNTFTINSETKITNIVIDPDNILPDANKINNSWNNLN